MTEVVKNSVGLKPCLCGCGQLISKINKRHEIAKYKHGHHMNGRKKEKCNNWKGGRTMHKGYVYIFKPEHRFAGKNGYVPEHRLVWEKYNNASLLPWSDVHHLNEIRSDNRIENLQAMMDYQHSALHAAKEMSDRICSRCKRSHEGLVKHFKRINWCKWRDAWLCNTCDGHARNTSNRKCYSCLLYRHEN